MTYIEGFVIAVPTANKQKFIDHAEGADPVFLEHGAIRIVECWPEDVARGHTTDFFGAVQAEEGESVAFSWIEWPDRATRKAMADRMGEIASADERFDPVKHPIPFDGARMIYGGFDAIVERGTRTPGAYVQGFVVPVPDAKKEAYRAMAEEAWKTFREYGALRIVEAWQDDVPEGKRTDFFRSVKTQPGEKVVFSFVEWPSREVCDAASARMQSEAQPQSADAMPFDGKRMIFGGFRPVVELEGSSAGG